MGNKHSPRQERGRQRRQALLRAAISLLGEAGAKSVTHRAVAERAGLPLASTTYYFESVDELIEEALKLHVAERVAELQEMAAVALGAASASAQDIAERLAEVLVAAPGPILAAQYQLYLEAGRNPALQPAVAEALAAFEGLAAGVLTTLGARPGTAPAGSSACRRRPPARPGRRSSGRGTAAPRRGPGGRGPTP